MADEGSSGILPAGWTEQIEIKNGDEIRCYFNMESGQKSYSINDIIHNVENANISLDNPEGRSKHDESLEHKAVPLAMEKNPEWLPEGWTMELKIQKSGRKYKCYVDPLTSKKFYSKPDVLDYLRTVNGNSSAAKQKEMDASSADLGELSGGKTPSKRGRSKNVKTSKVTSRTATATATATAKRKKKGLRKGPAKKFKVEMASPDGLPSGWKKEIRTQRKGNGIRKDPYYTDPVNGYVFRSKKDALRYLESGDFSKCAIKPKKRSEMKFLD